MSNTFIKIALYNIEKARQLETKKYKNQNTKEKAIEEHMGHVVGALFSSIAFLEATINEIFMRCLNKTNMYPNMTDKQKEIMGEFWKEVNSNRINQFDENEAIKEELFMLITDRKKNQDKYRDSRKILKKVEKQIEQGRVFSPILLNKYQFALFINNKELYNGNNSIYKNVNLVRNLRNNITHYVPDIENKKIQIMVADLKNKNFQLNNLISGKSIYTFFPHKCLSYSCAEWAYNSCIDFVNDFYNRMDFPFYYSNNIFSERDNL